MFRCVRTTENISWSMIEDRENVERLVYTNFVFPKTIPNLVQYWADRKKDFLLMMRPFGKPTTFVFH